jgi:hypothetical protein
MTSSTPTGPVRVFISYRHANHSVRDEVRKHLGWLENSDQIEVFDDREILAGDEWDARIKAELEQAQIIILIVTADFMHSPYCTKVELKSALERRAREETRVIPIIAEACDWEAMPIFTIAALPKDKANNLKPLNKWRGDKDVALTQIAQQVRRNVGRLTVITDQQPKVSAGGHVPLAPRGFLSWLRQQPDIFFSILLDTNRFFSNNDNFRKENFSNAIGYFLLVNVILILLSVPTELYLIGKDALSYEQILSTIAGNFVITMMQAFALRFSMLIVLRNADVLKCVIMSLYMFSIFIILKPATYVTTAIVHEVLRDDSVADATLGDIPFCAFEAVSGWSLLFMSVLSFASMMYVVWKFILSIKFQFRIGIWKSSLVGSLTFSVPLLIVYTLMLPLFYQSSSHKPEATGGGIDLLLQAQGTEIEPNNNPSEANRIEIDKSYQGRVRENESDLFTFENTGDNGIYILLVVHKIDGFGCVDAGIYGPDKMIISKLSGYKILRKQIFLTERGRYFIVFKMKNHSTQDEYWRYVMSVKQS